MIGVKKKVNFAQFKPAAHSARMLGIKEGVKNPQCTDACGKMMHE